MPLPSLVRPGRTATVEGRHRAVTRPAYHFAMFLFREPSMPKPADALPGRTEPMPGLTTHYVNGRPLLPPYPDGLEVADFAFGCFWGAEKDFWETPGVWVTAVGYAGGYTPNPTYREACTGKTGHAEAVRVVFDPKLVSYEQLLKVFWETPRPDAGHAPGQRHRDPVPLRDLHPLGRAAAPGRGVTRLPTRSA